MATPHADTREGPGLGSNYPLLLLVFFGLLWLALAISPSYRQDWLLENLLVFVALPLLVWNYPRLRFSNTSYSLIFLFLSLHEVGAHYTYAEVPYDRWLQDLTGFDIQARLGFERNHFDRLVHFCFGLLLMPAFLELLEARGRLVGLWRYILPIAMVMASSELFEMVEWQAAEIFGGPLGQAYLGAQGDIWDAQKDSAMAAMGGVIGLAFSLQRRRPPRF